MNPSALTQIFEPSAIERQSFAIIDSEIPEPRPFSGQQWEVARRLLHTSADYDLLNHIRFHPLAVKAGIEALKSGAKVVTDTRMAMEGIPLRRRQALGFSVECNMTDPEVVQKAKEQGCTRAKLCMELLAGEAPGQIVAIGNAPTALIALLELIEQGRAAPALIIGMPVGFVNAAESKELLLAQNRIPYITIAGRKGGSALAAATVNALAELALASRTSSS